MAKKKTDEEKKEELYRYLSNCRMDTGKDQTCQWIGKPEDGRFCRATSQKTCKGCKYYRPSIWSLFAKVYDIIMARDKEITMLQKQKWELESYIDDLKAGIGLK